MLFVNACTSLSFRQDSACACKCAEGGYTLQCLYEGLDEVWMNTLALAQTLSQIQLFIS